MNTKRIDLTKLWLTEKALGHTVQIVFDARLKLYRKGVHGERWYSQKCLFCGERIDTAYSELLKHLSEHDGNSVCLKEGHSFQLFYTDDGRYYGWEPCWCKRTVWFQAKGGK